MTEVIETAILMIRNMKDQVKIAKKEIDLYKSQKEVDQQTIKNQELKIKELTDLL